MDKELYYARSRLANSIYFSLTNKDLGSGIIDNALRDFEEYVVAFIKSKAWEKTE